MQNHILLADFYEFTMMYGYFKSGLHKKTAYFDMYFRDIPDNAGYAVMAGVQKMTEDLHKLRFSAEDIDYLRSLALFDEEFLDYLKKFKLSCDVWAIPEGTPIFPNEPIVIVRGTMIEAQLIETLVLLNVNHQTLIATKSARIVRAAGAHPVIEFGARRAQGFSAALYGARSAYIGGVIGTSCTLADKKFGIPVYGTMAHSWVQSYDCEYEAFRRYAEIYPDSCVLLVDTYNTLKSGIPNAIRVFDEILKPMGIKNMGIRLDSGDITYLSKKGRRMLNDAGYSSAKIIASNSLDEHIIRDLINQGAEVDIFGVGERLITSKSSPVFGGVYKLSAIEDDNGNILPKIKISENVAKITTPYFKKVYRLFSKENGMAIADVITAYDEIIDDSKEYVIFDPVHTWKKKTVTNFEAKELLVKIIEKGEVIYTHPSLAEIKEYCKDELARIWDEIKRFENPHTHYVDLSRKLWDIKYGLLKT